MRILFKKKICNFVFVSENISPSKRVICFILTNSHLAVVKSIAFYALYKANDFCLFIASPDKI